MKSTIKAKTAKTDIKKNAALVIELLEQNYGIPKPEPYHQVDALEILILTVLSQNTNDTNRDRAMESLRSRFPTWGGIAAADRREIEKAIRVGGLAHQKSERIKTILNWVKSEFGVYSIEKLGRMPSGEAHDILMSLKGVGPKTAAIVLLFGFGIPVFPVDTHIHRAATRLGFLRNGLSAEEAHKVLGELFPAEKYYSAHLNIIHHGRTTCKARKPFCGKCCLREECSWPEKNPGEFI